MSLELLEKVGVLIIELKMEIYFIFWLNCFCRGRYVKFKLLGNIFYDLEIMGDIWEIKSGRFLLIFLYFSFRIILFVFIFNIYI